MVLEGVQRVRKDFGCQIVFSLPNSRDLSWNLQTKATCRSLDLALSRKGVKETRVKARMPLFAPITRLFYRWTFVTYQRRTFHYTGKFVV
jgi:hypothetical protein